MSRAEQHEDTELRDTLLTIIAAAYQVAAAHDAPAHILDVLANPEGATGEQIEAMLPYQPGLLLTVSYNDLMTLARRLIAEQLDNCDEDFMAGRAHGIGSLHAEILGLAKRPALAQMQDDPKTAGTPETCRSSEKVQVRGYCADCNSWGGEHQGGCKRRPGRFSQGTARCAIPTDLAQEALSTLLWLYRRLPRGYGRPPTVEGPILALAKQTGIDVTDCLAERGPDQQTPNENN